MQKFVDFHLSFHVHLEQNAQDHHKLILEHVREYDSESYSGSANKTSILESCS